MNRNSLHPEVDIEEWIARFPLADFEKQEGPRKYSGSEPDDPIDLWKACGPIISYPSDLAVLEQVRRRVSQRRDLGRRVPTDMMVYALGEAPRPYLTKVGGVPYRPAGAPWPCSEDRRPYVFVAQFCFADSNDILPSSLPGDVMLVFGLDDEWHVGWHADSVRIEWYDLDISRPVAPAECPEPQFHVPCLHCVRHRTFDYPDAEDVFYNEGHDDFWLFARSQATRIGGTTWFIQGDQREGDETLLCTLNSIEVVADAKYPFVNLESARDLPGVKIGTLNLIKELSLEFGDAGCVYFVIDPEGEVRWWSDCY